MGHFSLDPVVLAIRYSYPTHLVIPVLDNNFATCDF